MNGGAEAVREALGRDHALGFAFQLMKDCSDAEIFLVGGFVRDALLGHPSKDADFVVRGISQEKLEAWLSEYGEVVFVGRAFGVYKFKPSIHPEHDEIDIALPRTEVPTQDSLGGYRDFSMKSDAMLSIEDDLARRDFTINAIAYNLKDNTLVDPFGGLKDLEAKILRTVGEPKDRFAEDLSRVLRGIRFSATLDFTIEDATWWAIKDAASHINRTREVDDKTVFVVPRETVGTELVKAIHANPHASLKHLHDAGLMRELFPELEHLVVHSSYLDVLSKMHADAPPDAVFAVLLRGIPTERVGALLHQSGLDALPRTHPLRLHANDITWIVATLQDGRPDPTALVACDFERFFMNERAPAYLAALTAQGHEDEARRARLRAAEIRARWWATDDEKIPPLVSGNDATNLGLAPGPAVRLLLDAMRSAQLEGQVKNRTAALHMMEQLIKEME